MVQDPTTLAVSWTTTKTSATTFTSATTTGLIDIKGLDYGSYKLTEILAPTGYALLGAPIDFTVDATSYNTTSPTQITNNLNPSIPATGGIGSVIFVLVGLAIMGVAVFGLKKRATHKA